MDPRRQLILLRVSLSVIAAVLFLFSAPCVLFGVLGLLGMADDVGPGENARIGLRFLGIGFVPALLGGVVMFVASRVRLPAGRCASCGYDLRGTAGRCPECGATALAEPGVEAASTRRR